MLLKAQQKAVRRRAAEVERDRAELVAARARLQSAARRSAGSPLGLSAAFAAGLLFGWAVQGRREGTAEGGENHPVEHHPKWLDWARLLTSTALLVRRLHIV